MTYFYLVLLVRGKKTQKTGNHLEKRHICSIQRIQVKRHIPLASSLDVELHSLKLELLQCTYVYMDITSIRRVCLVPLRLAHGRGILWLKPDCACPTGKGQKNRLQFHILCTRGKYRSASAAAASANVELSSTAFTAHVNDHFCCTHYFHLHIKSVYSSQSYDTPERVLPINTSLSIVPVLSQRRWSSCKWTHTPLCHMTSRIAAIGSS